VQWQDGPWFTSCNINYEERMCSNGSVIRWERSGAEDPKVFLSGYSASSPSVLFSSVPPDACSWSGEPPQTQMYLAAEVFPAGGGAPQGRRLSCQSEQHPEKNWIPFMHGDELYLVSTLVPKVIVRAERGGMGTCDVAYTEDAPLLTALSTIRNLTFLKGTASAFFIDSPTMTPNWPRPHYLALLHYSDQDGPYSYVTHAWRFAPEPPFEVVQISKSLPLTEKHAPPEQHMHVPPDQEEYTAPFAWASGLSVFEDTVVITYGAGDREARALVMTLDRLDQFFAEL